jgi:PQQ enzyme repeat
MFFISRPDDSSTTHLLGLVQRMRAAQDKYAKTRFVLDLVNSRYLQRKTASNQFAKGSSGNPNGLLLYKEGKLFNLNGRPYLPQDDGFGNRYLLTTKDGTVYEINATTGDLESVTDTNGNVLTYSDTEIKSSTGLR